MTQESPRQFPFRLAVAPQGRCERIVQPDFQQHVHRELGKGGPSPPALGLAHRAVELRRVGQTELGGVQRQQPPAAPERLRMVSLMGSMLSRAHEDRIVERVGDNGHVLLMFDEDGAGRKGRAEARERLSRRLSVSVARLEEGQQPDSLEVDALLGLIAQHAGEEVAA